MIDRWPGWPGQFRAVNPCLARRPAVKTTLPRSGRQQTSARCLTVACRLAARRNAAGHYVLESPCPGPAWPDEALFIFLTARPRTKTSLLILSLEPGGQGLAWSLPDLESRLRALNLVKARAA
jgi:hypothetical protein